MINSESVSDMKNRFIILTAVICVSIISTSCSSASRIIVKNEEISNNSSISSHFQTETAELSESKDTPQNNISSKKIIAKESSLKIEKKAPVVSSKKDDNKRAESKKTPSEKGASEAQSSAVGTTSSIITVPGQTEQTASSVDVSEQLIEEVTSNEPEKETTTDFEQASQTEEPKKPDDILFESPVCRSAALYCADDRELLYSDGIDTQSAPASLTKLLTACTALKYVRPDTIVTVGTEQYLVNEGSSLCGVSIGNRLTMYDLLTGMLMSSGNDAAYTAAVTTARLVHPDIEMSDIDAVSCFCEMMNDLGAEIGMTSSHFVNPDGWDDPQQYTIAADLIKLSEYALAVPEIRSIVGIYQKSVVFDSGEYITWTNTNALLNPYGSYYCENCIGMKTGTTLNAGCCFVGAFEKNGKTYISVALGCMTNDERFELTLKLISLI